MALASGSFPSPASAQVRRRAIAPGLRCRADCTAEPGQAWPQTTGTATIRVYAWDRYWLCTLMLNRCPALEVQKDAWAASRTLVSSPCRVSERDYASPGRRGFPLKRRGSALLRLPSPKSGLCPGKGLAAPDLHTARTH